MDRLTIRDQDGKAYWVDARCAGGGYRMTNDKRDQARLDRCAAYEDTGLEPGEIQQLTEDIESRFLLWLEKHYGIGGARFTELVDAERAGRCVVLPCKVGDTVYLTARGFVEETKVRTFFVGHPSYNRGEPDPRYEMIRLTNFDVPLKNFGKTIFITRKEAEAALGGGGDD